MAGWLVDCLTYMAVKMYDGNLSPVLMHRPQRRKRRRVVAAERDDPGCRGVCLVGSFLPRDDLEDEVSITFTPHHTTPRENLRGLWRYQ